MIVLGKMKVATGPLMTRPPPTADTRQITSTRLYHSGASSDSSKSYSRSCGSAHFSMRRLKLQNVGLRLLVITRKPSKDYTR